MSEQTCAARAGVFDGVARVLAGTAVLLLLANVGIVFYLAYDATADPSYASFGDEQIHLARAVVRDEPYDPAAHLDLAYAYLQVGRWDDALHHCETALGLEPSDTAALGTRGMILLEHGRLEEAEESLQAALELDPGHVLSAVTLAEHYLSVDRPQMAATIADEAARHAPRSADLYHLAGLAHEALGDLDTAEERYRQALGVYPDMLGAREGLDRLEVSR